jgi:hypothetical protein
MILTAGRHFIDEFGRRLLLRGVNLGGSSKVPYQPDGATYRREGFFDHRNVSFVGRPFPLDEADEHFARLKAWGFTFLRLLVTWEAVEHAGPGLYDEDYLDYLRQVVIRAGEHGINLFIDPHQDAWSRFSGGDGAPGWTLEAAGLDMTHFEATGAAITHQLHGDPFETSSEARGPRMIWPTNYTKLACATMFTLFFAGNDFAPLVRIDGEPIQNYLQRHYLLAMQQVALHLKDLPNVVGYETMNEPLSGYIGCRDLGKPFGRLKLGDCPTPFQSMLLAAGIPQQVETWKLGRLSLKRTGRRWLNLQGESAWLPGGAQAGCLWKRHGVWDFDRSGEPVLLQPGYFTRAHGQVVDFNRDYLVPFSQRFARAIRQVMPAALIFVECDPTEPVPPRAGGGSMWGEGDVDGLVFAPHWYDALTLLTKHYTPLAAVDELTGRAVFGAGRIRKSFAAQLAQRKAAAKAVLGAVPTLIGETGIPFDLDDRQSFRSGDFSQQALALERVFRALEDNLLSCTLWNYTPDNTNLRGDLWNGEDFSIFCRDQQRRHAGIHSGGRALEAAVRPYPARMAGELQEMSFDSKTKVLRFSFRHDPQVTAPSEVFVPRLQYPNGMRVEVSDGRWKHHPEHQLLIYAHTSERDTHSLVISPGI